MNPYADMVLAQARRRRDGLQYPLGGFPTPAWPAAAAGAPTALIFSPHPDDECIIGGLAVRLRRQSGWRIVNVAVTQGSNRARQTERWVELQAACDYLGFGLRATAPNGLERVTPKARAGNPSEWAASVSVIADILNDERPTAIFFPHERDWNGTHIGVHHLVMDALRQLGSGFETRLVETEYWGQMDSPNRMVELTPDDVVEQVTALSFHAGEVRRNPFHLLLPAWMQDNVRRGSELVGGQGGAAPDIDFATLYRVGGWSGGRRVEVERGRFVAAADAPEGALTL